jgi:tripeptide aminopeptidase
VLAELRSLGIDADEDDSGERIGSDAGNVYCRLPATAAGTPLFLCAHMDTVLPLGPIEPVVDDDGIVRNAAGTILGADNKAALAAMLEATRRVVEDRRPHAGLELVVTTSEEIGLRGASAFDHDRLAARIGYVYDQAAPIGEVILGAPHQRAIEVRFRGRAAHAGIAPEEISASGASTRRRLRTSA